MRHTHPLRPSRLTLALVHAFPLTLSMAALPVARAQTTDQESSTKSLGIVVVTGTQPTSLPTTIPTTIEGITRAKIEASINATDSEDALKYFPSLLVRKRYIGDYNHAILSSRASGTGNSARSAVYADGILLSNFLGNGVGGLSFPPRWGLVTPEEIERVDVMYGPFSAAYPGNSVGAVVDYVTRMPTRFEAHAKAGYYLQPFSLYSTDTTYRAWQTSASLGNKSGDWAWWVNVNHTDSHGQPLTFATRTLAQGTATAAAGTTPVAVSGAIPEKNPNNADIYVLGTGTEFHTKQDHLKVKLAYDLTSTVRAFYTFGLWQNTSEGRPVSYLQSASGGPVYNTNGAANPLLINGRYFPGLSAGDFALTNEQLTHTIHGLTVKSNTKGTWDWSLAASLYDYGKDQKRQNGTTLPAAAVGGAGTIADGAGTGWTTLAARGIWRPDGVNGAHIVDFGAQQDGYHLKYLTSNITGNWLSDGAGSVASNVGGDSRLHSLFAQDAWRLAPDWTTVLGGRLERWSTNGYTQIGSSVNTLWPKRQETYFSPKAALSWQALGDTVLKASLGRAVRMPTVAELYGATSTTNSQYINDPTLHPERSWTGELSWEQALSQGTWRLTYFAENTRDSLYSQTTVQVINGVNTNVSRVQNIGRIATQGLETAFSGTDVGQGIGLRGLDLQASLTYANSVIKENAGFVNVPGDTLGKQQPNIPHWRSAALALYRWNEQLTTSLAARYSSNQYRTLNNADVNGYTYQGVSKYFTTDLRVRYQFDKQWSGAFGIDNLNNYKYWNFHPYPQRTYSAELKFDL
jgi:iron complex outermembrane receptor protein